MKQAEEMELPKWEDVYSMERRIAELEKELETAVELLHRIDQLSREKGSTQWLRKEIAKWRFQR